MAIDTTLNSRVTTGVACILAIVNIIALFILQQQGQDFARELQRQGQHFASEQQQRNADLSRELHKTPTAAPLAEAPIWYNTIFTEGGGSATFHISGFLGLSSKTKTGSLNLLHVILQNRSPYPARKIIVSVVADDGFVCIGLLPPACIFTDLAGQSIRFHNPSWTPATDEILVCDFVPPNVGLKLQFFYTGKKPTVTVMSEWAMGEYRADLKMPADEKPPEVPLPAATK